MPGYFDATTESVLASDWHEDHSTREAVQGLPRMMDNFDRAIAGMKDARKTLQDADAGQVAQDTFKEMGAGLIEVLTTIINYVEQSRPQPGVKGVIPSEGMAARMRSGS